MESPRILFVHAHPDDESLWTGGTIARVVDQGSVTSVITCTWAAGTHRHAELETALRILGVDSAWVLGYADAGFPESAPQAASLCESLFDDSVRRIAEQIRMIRPDVVVTYDAYGIYGHPDHIHTHRLTTAAVEAAACGPLYPEAGDAWQTRSLYMATVPTRVMRLIRHQVNAGAPVDGAATPGTPDAAIDLEIDVSPWVEKKWSAISAHGSEMRRSPALLELAALDVDRRNALLGVEWYLRRDLVPGGAALIRALDTQVEED